MPSNNPISGEIWKNKHTNELVRIVEIDTVIVTAGFSPHLIVVYKKDDDARQMRWALNLGIKPWIAYWELLTEESHD